MRFCALLLSGMTLVATSARAADEARAELRKMDGRWVLAKGEEAGKPMPEATINNAWLTIVGVNHSVKLADQVLMGTHRLDPSQEPKTIDCRDSAGPYAGKVMHGIYRLKDETLEVCFSRPGEERPKDFSSKDGLHHVWQRKKIFDQQTLQDLRRFQGRWVLVTGVRDGQEMPKEEVEKVRLLIRGSVYVFPSGATADAGEQGSFAIETGKQPKAIDAAPLSGPNQGKVFRGIYEIDRESSKVCWGPPGEDRPTDFTSKPGDRRLLQTWKRQPRQESARPSE